MKLLTFLKKLDEVLDPYLQPVLNPYKDDIRIIPAGTNLYHGTDASPENWLPAIDEIRVPAWFSETPEHANEYANFQRSGDYDEPVVVNYIATKPLKLINIPVGLIDELTHHNVGYAPEDVGLEVCEMGYDGWSIADQEIMICDPAAIKYMRSVIAEDAPQLYMSKGARMKRAEAMGYDTSTVWYHANTGGIEGEGFDDSRLPASDPDRPFNAHWFSHEPSEFAAYPSTGNTITPVFLALDKSKEAPYGVWRKLTAQVYDAWDKGDNKRNAADMIREKLVSMGYTHAIRGREPIDAEELKSTGETSFMTSTGTKVTLKWEKLNLPPKHPEFTDEEMEHIKAHMEAKRMYDTYQSVVIDTVVNDKMTPELSEKLKARGIEVRADMDRLGILANAAEERAYEIVNAEREQIDSLEMYDSDIGHVTGYSDLADFERMSPEKEDIAVLDPSIIRSIHAAFDPAEDGNNKIMSSLGESTMTLYHGSQNEFDEFDSSKIGSSSGNRGFVGRGFYFTPIKRNAEAYGNVKAYNVTMNNPFMITGPLSGEQAEILGNVSETYAFDAGMTPDDVWGGLSYSVPDHPEIADSITNGLEGLGYDGVIIKTRDHHEFVAFSPKQIVPVKQGMNEVRGPHEGKELELMMQGKKPLAMIELHREPPEKQDIWDKLIRSERVVHRQGVTIETPQDEGRHDTDFIALPDEAWRIDSIQNIYHEINRTDNMTDNDHIDIGNLLGYSEADIRHFITGFDDDGHDGFRDEDRAMAKRMGYKVNEEVERKLYEVERTPPTVAYHATFPDNRDSIRLHGLDPKYDTQTSAVYFATGSKPDPKMDIWKANLSGLEMEYDNVQVAGELGWGDNEHWWYTEEHVVPDRLTLVQKGKR